MRITIDSTEPLDRVLPVINALYGVSLTNQESAAVAAPRKRSGRTSGTRGPVRRRKQTATVEPAAVRAWARSTGRTVSDRGRLPAELVAAYAGEH